MKTSIPRWTIAFAGAVALHGAVIGMVPWSKTVALSERSAGEEAEVWGAPSHTVVMELATVEQVSGEETEMAEEVQEATTTSEAEPVDVEEPEPVDVAEAQPVDVAEAEPVVEEQQVAMAEPEVVEQPDEVKPVETVTEVEPEKPIEEPREVAEIDPESPMEPVEEVKETEVTEVSEAVVVPEPKPQEVVEKKPEPKKVAEVALKKTVKAKIDNARKATKDQKAKGNSQISVSAASGVAKGNQGVRQTADAGWSNRSNYAGKIVAHLQRYKNYPREAADKHLTGTATLTFSISADGRLQSVSLRGSSGTVILDQAALATVRRASPFPAIPSEAGVASMTFTVPLRYRQM